MTYWLEKGVHYWEGGERQGAVAIQVPQRPGPDYVWDGTQWQDNSDNLWKYDKPNMVWILKSASEVAFDREIWVRMKFLSDETLLIGLVLVMLECNAIRKGEARPAAVQKLIDLLKEYMNQPWFQKVYERILHWGEVV